MKIWKGMIGLIIAVALIDCVPLLYGKPLLHKEYTYSSDIQKVRNGHLNGTKTTTIARALEGYFDSPHWGEITYMDMPSVVFQGIVNENNNEVRFQMLFPKYSGLMEINLDNDFNFDDLPVNDIFVNSSSDLNRGKEILKKAYEKSGEMIAFQ